MMKKQSADLENIDNSCKEMEQHISSDENQIAALGQGLEVLLPQLEQAKIDSEKALSEHANVDELMHEWQKGWDEFNQKASVPSETAQIQRTRIEHIEKQIVQAQIRLERTQTQLKEVNVGQFESQIKDLTESEKQKSGEVEEAQQSLENIKEQITQLRQQNQEKAQQLNDVRGSLQTSQGRLSSLEALQQAALGKSDNKVMQWLEQHNLKDAPRLVQEMEVEPGWETAVEAVMGLNLEAVGVDDFNSVSDLLETIENGSIAFFDKHSPASSSTGNLSATPLSNYVKSPWPIESLMTGAYAVAELSEALSLRAKLSEHESIITKEGVWVGRSWLRLIKEQDAKSGVIAREQEIKSLSLVTAQYEEGMQALQVDLDKERDRQHEFEQSRELQQQEVNQLHRKHSDIASQLNSMGSRLEQLKNRRENLLNDQAETEKHMEQDGVVLKEARSILNQSLDSINEFAREREILSEK
ncbi:MAG: hypothetical protein GXP13_04580 [Gammaproteobacteria bacterium]|nr:hypothetical protein [Gammaproteobacteria bacterium]